VLALASNEASASRGAALATAYCLGLGLPSAFLCAPSGVILSSTCANNALQGCGGDTAGAPASVGNGYAGNHGMVWGGPVIDIPAVNAADGLVTTTPKMVAGSPTNPFDNKPQPPLALAASTSSPIGSCGYPGGAIPNTVKFISENFPGKTIGTVYNAGEQNSVAQVEIIKDSIKELGLKDLVTATVSTSAEVKQAAESLIGKADVIYVITDNTVVSALESVSQIANDNDLPLFVGEFDSVKRGGFAAYGFDYKDIGYEAGLLAAQILKGEKKPSELPAQYPQNLKLVINKEAAKEMNIELKDEWKDIAEFIE
jgi:hypothetical protein